MTRLLTIAGLLIAITAGACGDGNSPSSPTRGRPEAPAAKLSGTMTVAASLTATGGYQYTTQIHLTESGGMAATVSAVELAHTDAWGPYPAFAAFGAEAWSDSNVINANGTLTSKPLVATEELPSDYFYAIEATVTFGEGAAVSRQTISIYAESPPIPQPPPTARFSLTGMVIDGWDLLSDVTVEVLNGENAGRKAMTGPDGRYTIAGLRTGELSVRFSKTGYVATGTAVDLKSNRSLVYELKPEW